MGARLRQALDVSDARTAAANYFLVSGARAKTLSIGANSVSLAQLPQFAGLQEQAVQVPPDEQTLMQAQTSPLPPLCRRDSETSSGLSFSNGFPSATARICWAASDTGSCFWQEGAIRRTATASH